MLVISGDGGWVKGGNETALSLYVERSILCNVAAQIHCASHYNRHFVLTKQLANL
jgi:hypothetical protein